MPSSTFGNGIASYVNNVNNELISKMNNNPSQHMPLSTRSSGSTATGTSSTGNNNNNQDVNNLGNTNATLERNKNVFRTALAEFWDSTEIMFGGSVTWLLICGPIALVGDALGIFGEPTRFALAGLAMIPCAERLSFVTEQVAFHTNQTIGALLNATFGNAPELLISTAALRSGFYRVVQLTLLGSILCNLLLVFGVSCLIGGLRWQVQEVRMNSGNVSVGMLLLGATGLVLPAVLRMSNEEMFTSYGETDAILLYSRFNASVMLFMYICYLLFQLATHKDEFDDDDSLTSQNVSNYRDQRKQIKNIWCGKYYDRFNDDGVITPEELVVGNETNIIHLPQISMDGIEAEKSKSQSSSISDENEALYNDVELEEIVFDNNTNTLTTGRSLSSSGRENMPSRRVSVAKNRNQPQSKYAEEDLEEIPFIEKRSSNKSHNSSDFRNIKLGEEAEISFISGIIWLLVITICTSTISDIIVDTIDGFAQKSHLSEVFTSVIIIPFFSNIAEQVSAILFAYRNKMDLCVGITAGSAIQISLCVLPGCVLIGWAMDRSMTLFFNGFETCCLVMGVLSVSVVLQKGNTNWLAGLFFIGIYLMIAAGFWFHSREDLSFDEEDELNNSNSTVSDRHL